MEEKIQHELLREGYVILKDNPMYEQWVDIIKNGLDIWRYKHEDGEDKPLMFVGPSLRFAHSARSVVEAIRMSRETTRSESKGLL